MNDEDGTSERTKRQLNVQGRPSPSPWHATYLVIVLPRRSKNTRVTTCVLQRCMDGFPSSLLPSCRVIGLPAPENVLHLENNLGFQILQEVIEYSSIDEEEGQCIMECSFLLEGDADDR